MRKNFDYKFIIGREEPISEEKITRFEQENKITFPKILRQYYLIYGESKIKACQIIKDNFLTDVSEICFPEVFIKYGRKDGWLPLTFFPIAHDSGGNPYCWNTADDKVYLLFNDDVDPYLFCNSIEEFFKLMDESFN